MPPPMLIHDTLEYQRKHTQALCNILHPDTEKDCQAVGLPCRKCKNQQSKFLNSQEIISLDNIGRGKYFRA